VVTKFAGRVTVCATIGVLSGAGAESSLEEVIFGAAISAGAVTGAGRLGWGGTVGDTVWGTLWWSGIALTGFGATGDAVLAGGAEST